MSDMTKKSRTVSMYECYSCLVIQAATEIYRFDAGYVCLSCLPQFIDENEAQTFFFLQDSDAVASLSVEPELLRGMDLAYETVQVDKSKVLEYLGGDAEETERFFERVRSSI
jgi:hypothetical protein